MSSEAVHDDPEWPKLRKRTRARELALQALYQVDTRGDEVRDDLDDFMRRRDSDREVCEFARALIDGCLRERDALDEAIVEVARNWQLARMAVIDRNILRLAVYELLYLDDVPPKVVINEACEVARLFCDENAVRFVNGLLDRASRLDDPGPAETDGTTEES